MPTDDRVALWYWRHFRVKVSLYDTEEDAAQAGLTMMIEGHANVAGVQFSDGRFINLDSWAAWDVVAERLESEQLEAGGGDVLATRRVHVPFHHTRTARVPEDYPDWVGRR
jgi:hypothetical protein